MHRYWRHHILHASACERSLMCLAGVHSCVNEPHVARLLRTPRTTALQALPAHQDSATVHNPGLRACAERYVNNPHKGLAACLQSSVASNPPYAWHPPCLPPTLNPLATWASLTSVPAASVSPLASQRTPRRCCTCQLHESAAHGRCTGRCRWRSSSSSSSQCQHHSDDYSNR